MKTLHRDQLIYAMNKGHKPVLQIKPGESVLVETEDCFTHQVVAPGYSLDRDFDLAFLNPATGPIAVEGAEPGDTLQIYIEEINLDPQGVTVAYRGWGPLGAEVEETHVRIVEVRGQHAFFNGERLPLNPMIGVIGVAPANGSVPNSTPGPHGGNMDTKEITAGAILYLPVFVAGANLSLGDLHAVMADGEVCGTGLEIGGSVRLRVEIVKNSAFSLPVVEDGQAFYFVGSSPQMEEAVRLATSAAVAFISKRNAISWIDAYMLTSLRCDLMFSQVVNPWKTVKMRVGKDLLKTTGNSF